MRVDDARTDARGRSGRSGMVGRALDWLFGARVQRLREVASRTHWLSYLLIISQSIAVILVFGHAEVGLLLTRNLAEMIGAALALFVLAITVMAADIALLDTLTRVAPLARNRQSVMLSEHVAYTIFVLAVEGSTYGIVLYVLDSNPEALVRSAPLIPTSGAAFLALVLMRVMLICWSAVQLIIVRGKLPVLLSTLMNVGKEIVGAHVERQLTELDLADIPVRDTFSVYAQMAQAPRPTRGLFNGWAVRRALARETEENRQADNIAASLAALTSHRLTATNATTAVATIERPVPPTDGGESPSRLNSAAKRAAIQRDMLTARAYDLDADDSDGGWSARNAAAAGDRDEFDMAWDDGEIARASHPTRPRSGRAPTARLSTLARELVTDLPTGKSEHAGDTPEARRVMRYLDKHPGAKIADVISGAKVGRSTARRYYTAWLERNKRQEPAPFTEEMEAVTPAMLSNG